MTEDCLICTEKLDKTEIASRPCVCGFKICRFCWHKIKEGDKPLCPACRRPYEDNVVPVGSPQHFQPKRRKKKKQPRMPTATVRKNLGSVRVLQRNLVYLTNLALTLAKEELLRSYEYFGQYGRIVKVVINKTNLYNTNSPHGPSVSAYITYAKELEAVIAIKCVDGAWIGNRTLKATLGTTKYCNYFLRGARCNNTECMYLHALGKEEDSFSKEDMALGKHVRELSLPSNYTVKSKRKPSILPSPATLLEEAKKKAQVKAKTMSKTRSRAAPKKLSHSSPATASKQWRPKPAEVGLSSSQKIMLRRGTDDIKTEEESSSDLRSSDMSDSEELELVMDKVMDMKIPEDEIITPSSAAKAWAEPSRPTAKAEVEPQILFPPAQPWPARPKAEVSKPVAEKVEPTPVKREMESVHQPVGMMPQNLAPGMANYTMIPMGMNYTPEGYKMWGQPVYGWAPYPMPQQKDLQVVHRGRLAKVTPSSMGTPMRATAPPTAPAAAPAAAPPGLGGRPDGHRFVSSKPRHTKATPPPSRRPLPPAAASAKYPTEPAAPMPMAYAPPMHAYYSAPSAEQYPPAGSYDPAIMIHGGVMLPPHLAWAPPQPSSRYIFARPGPYHYPPGMKPSQVPIRQLPESGTREESS